MNLGKRVIAEFLGTFWLTFGGCGSAVIAAAYPQLGIGFLGVALAFGLTVVDNGLCRWTYFRRSLQPSDHDRRMGRGADPFP